MRASDAEREAVADRLRAASVDGRLDPDELEERLADAYRAKTHAELARVTEDLPEKPAPLPSRWRQEHVRERLAAFITPNLVCIAVWAATGAHTDDFWPKWVLLFTGIGLVATLVRTALGVQEPAKRHERRRLPE